MDDGAPRRWFGGSSPIVVKNAPTRWGRISFALQPTGAEQLTGTITLPRPGLDLELRLRLRAPAGSTMRRVTVNGELHRDIDAAGEYVRFVRPAAKTLSLRVEFR